MVKRIGINGTIGFIAAYLLYKNIYVSIFAMLVFVLYGVLEKKDFIKNRKERTRAKFLDFLMCLEPLLKTHGTFCGAFSEAVIDYKRFHGKDELSIYLDSAANDFKMNMPTVEILGKMADKLDIEDAYIFAGSMVVCESTGGKAVEITEKTTEILVGKTRLLCEINTLLSGKVFEQKIITAMPFAMLCILSVSARSYLAPMYTTAAGRIVMTAAGVLFLFQWYIGRKITDIKV